MSEALKKERTDREKAILKLIDSELSKTTPTSGLQPPVDLDINLPSALLTQFMTVMAVQMAERIDMMGDFTLRYLITKDALAALEQEGWEKRKAEQAINALFDHASFLVMQRDESDFA